ncbi:MAG: hypothetical protein ACXVGA_00970 [Mycobacteriaceae bacterium]
MPYSFTHTSLNRDRTPAAGLVRDLYGSNADAIAGKNKLATVTTDSNGQFTYSHPAFDVIYAKRREDASIYPVESPEPNVGTDPTGIDALLRANYLGGTPNFMPVDHGLVAWSYDPIISASSAVSTGGTAVVCRVHVPVGSTITKALLYISAAGATLTSGQCFINLYDPTKALIGTSADQSAAWQSTGLKTITLTEKTTGSMTNLAAGDYYVMWWANGTTIPAWRGAATVPIINANLSATNSRFATADTGLTTTAPTTLGTFAAASTAYWCALA